jgi:hypothetical protein
MGDLPKLHECPGNCGRLTTETVIRRGKNNESPEIVAALCRDCRETMQRRALRVESPLDGCREGSKKIPSRGEATAQPRIIQHF